ncbi:LAMI_0G01992g1_1 [Lachancea mirantina]|uniref:LAMI_0G01992g1_1 n=1 Tax=Lachancea mirantina TaxID=1230905 RepID=A0A1G4K7N3_9SACH|nr:LAMI_0G01992g1_1 [Lachancea mirantina]
MSNSLEERVKLNSNAFEGLLSLIPAKYYYDDKTQEQWKARKKSKADAKRDKRRKLDPAQQNQESASALEVMKMREKTAKPVVLPGAARARADARESDGESGLESGLESSPQRESSEGSSGAAEAGAAGAGAAEAGAPEPDASHSGDEVESLDFIFDDEGNEVRAEEPATAPANPPAEPVLEAPAAVQQNKQKNLDRLREKLQEKLRMMKEKRKAPGSQADGAPLSRDAILAQRKRRQALKRKRADDEKQNEEQNSDDSDSNSDSDDDMGASGKPVDDEDLARGVMFQSIEFEDGDRTTSDLQRLRKSGKKKGPAKNDIKAHLKLAEARRAKLEGREELEQIQTKEKEKWQRAMLQAEGQKFRDDEKLLRKALKRKENKKRKSAQEWRDREQNVATQISERQKRREENLQIRRDNKGKKRNSREKMKRGFKGPNPSKKRAGFEGRLKSGKKK